jgi:serine protease DegQ
MISPGRELRPLARPKHSILSGCVALSLSVLALAGCGASSSTTSSATGASSPGTNAAAAPTGEIPKIVDRVEPEVVTVLTPNGGVGSGVIYRSDGIILTNEHVVRGSTSVEIAFADGSRDPGTVTSEDADTDLALVRVKRKYLPVASFTTALPQVGSLDVVLGSPLGFSNTVTAGIISGLHRSIPGSAQESAALVDLMQTDAPISPGNSGGAVVDAQGKVIGITDAYIPPQQGAVAIGFAIPAATAVSVADQLLKSGRVEHAFIGIQPAQLTPEVARDFGLSELDGVLVYGVSPNGPAADAGIEPGDVMTSLAGEPLESVEQIYATLRRYRPGQSIQAGLMRDGHARTVTIKLSSKPQ